ncbi:hypothetical protein MalM25_28690 [Planctomycetes bacterium MalM25]|nr:hypothetical protein MalM25_28690 [Planctomycetes bacterium MalM25]
MRLGLSRRLGEYVSLSSEFFWVGIDDDYAASSDGNPGLMRPFLNTDPASLGEDAELIAFDDPTLGDVVDGSVAIDLDYDIYSASLACRVDLLGECGSGVAGLIGYRFFRFEESLNVSTQSVVQSTGGAVAQGTTFDVRDSLGATNEFHGLDLGLVLEDSRGPWGVTVTGKVAVGGNRRESLIAGSTTTTVPTIAPFVEVGGLLTQTTNAGKRRDNRFALLPELRVDIRRRIGASTEVRVGYTLLYLTDALRTGVLIDRRVDGRLLDPGPPPAGATDPAFQSPGSTVWLQGINLGLIRTY